MVTFEWGFDPSVELCTDKDLNWGYDRLTVRCVCSDWRESPQRSDDLA